MDKDTFFYIPGIVAVLLGLVMSSVTNLQNYFQIVFPIAMLMLGFWFINLGIIYFTVKKLTEEIREMQNLADNTP